MPCYRPVPAYRGKGGAIVFTIGEAVAPSVMLLPCNGCIGCRLEKARQWTVRCVHEASLHDHNAFLTLTYSPEMMPESGSLDKRHWQLFAKRVRKNLGPFRFLHVGEYGPKTFRPHYHALMFGCARGHPPRRFFDDRVLWKVQNGSPLFVSKELEELWGLGQCSIGEVTPASAAYVARYTMKKLTGEQAEEMYRRIDLKTGEEYYVQPEYATMSRRPGLGAGWFEKYANDTYPSDEVIYEGKRMRPPRYYDALYERRDPSAILPLRVLRRARAYAAGAAPQGIVVREEGEQSRTRLRVRARVALAKVKFHAREDI